MSTVIGHRRAATTVALLALLSSVAVGGCGNDDDAAAGADDAYCELAVELDEQEDFPSAAQLEAYRDAAPEDISDSVDLVVNRFLEAIENGDPLTAYSDPAVEGAFEPIETYEAEHCGIERKP